MRDPRVGPKDPEVLKRLRKAWGFFVQVFVAPAAPGASHTRRRTPRQTRVVRELGGTRHNHHQRGSGARAPCRPSSGHSSSASARLRAEPPSVGVSPLARPAHFFVKCRPAFEERQPPGIADTPKPLLIGLNSPPPRRPRPPRTLRSAGEFRKTTGARVRPGRPSSGLGDRDDDRVPRRDLDVLGLGGFTTKFRGSLEQADVSTGLRPITPRWPPRPEAPALLLCATRRSRRRWSRHERSSSRSAWRSSGGRADLALLLGL